MGFSFLARREAPQAHLSSVLSNLCPLKTANIAVAPAPPGNQSGKIAA
jgi:hypothetical protein